MPLPWSELLRGFFMARAAVSEADETYLRRALELARQGGHTHPNPLVGAVVVSGDVVIGEGFHRGPGTAHAEIVALEQAGARARGATLYVNLEPCAHFGRTPPCSRAIIAAGVRRVVIGMQDPHPLVNGAGISALRHADVEVVVVDGIVHEAAQQLNAAFVKAVKTGLPLVTYKAAISLDGKVAAASGAARWISSPESRRLVHAWRARADAILVGAETVRQDDPQLTARDVQPETEHQPREDTRPTSDRRRPVRVVLSRAGDVPLDAEVVRSARTTPTLLLTQAVPAERAAALRERGVEVVQAGPEASLHDLLAALAQRGLFDVLCEGGPTLAGALLTAGLIDRLALFVAPLIVGRGAPDVVAHPAPDDLSEALRLHDVSWEPSGPDLLVQGRVTQW